jgi:hypothetical protein
VLPELLNPLSLGNRPDCHAPELGYQIKILPSPGLWTIWRREEVWEMLHQNQQGPQPSPAPKLILFLPRSRCSRGCGRTGQSAEMAHLQQRLRPGNELNSSQDAHPMQKPAIKSCHRVEELALAGVQSDDSVATLPKCRPISGGTKRRGLRRRRSSPQQ